LHHSTPAGLSQPIVGEPINVHHLETDTKKERTGARIAGNGWLSGRYLNRFPHEFSGGQRQRIGIARALASNPDFIVCDEPIAAWMSPSRHRWSTCWKTCKPSLGLTYLFIAHDLSMVRHICNRVAVMYLGCLAELAESDTLYEHPLHPYTQALLSAVPVPNPKAARKRQRIILRG
jgi:oligopeptide transport system ATP-binding protein